MSREFQISEPVLQSLIDYLAKRPYAEVYQMIPVLQKLPVAELQDEPDASNVSPGS